MKDHMNWSQTHISDERVFEQAYYDKSSSLDKAEIWKRTDGTYYVFAWGGYDGFIKRDFPNKQEAQQYVKDLEEHNR